MNNQTIAKQSTGQPFKTTLGKREPITAKFLPAFAGRIFLEPHLTGFCDRPHYVCNAFVEHSYIGPR